MLRAAVATDAKSRAEPNLLELCRDAKEENYKLTDAIIPRRTTKAFFEIAERLFKKSLKVLEKLDKDFFSIAGLK